MRTFRKIKVDEPLVKMVKTIGMIEDEIANLKGSISGLVFGSDLWLKTIKKIEPNARKEDVIWDNLKETDKNLDLNLFAHCCGAWLKFYPKKTFQDLEKELRKRCFNTHLIAGSEIHPNMKLSEGCKYVVIYSCR